MQIFRQRCTGNHIRPHAFEQVYKWEYHTPHYPPQFGARAVQLMKETEQRQNRVKQFWRTMTTTEENFDDDAFECDEGQLICLICDDDNPCLACLESACPAVPDLMKEIPEDDEGRQELSQEQRLRRVHNNLGHPSNRLLAINRS